MREQAPDTRQHTRLLPLAIIGIALTLGGCAKQISLHAGASGPALPRASTLAIIGAPGKGTPVAAQAQEAVTVALEKHGLLVAPDASGRLEIGLTSRNATTGVAIIGGDMLSPAKKHKFLQSCRDRTYRLTLTYYSADAGMPATRAWAEEQHCKGPLVDSLPKLAEEAVTALAQGSSAWVSQRSGIE